MDEAADVARPRDVRDLEIPSDDRAVAEEATEEALLDLDGSHAREADRGGAAAQDAVLDEELVAGQDEHGGVFGELADDAEGREWKYGSAAGSSATGSIPIKADPAGVPSAEVSTEPSALAARPGMYATPHTTSG